MTFEEMLKLVPEDITAEPLHKDYGGVLFKHKGFKAGVSEGVIIYATSKKDFQYLWDNLYRQAELAEKN